MAATSIHIAQPCLESWDAMTPTGPGRHCAACQKTVIDFSLQTDAEILAYFQRPGGAGTCGRFRTTQLVRPLMPPAPAIAKRNWRAWLAAALALWGLRAEANTPGPRPAPPTHHTPRQRAKAAARVPRPSQRLSSGVVRDADTQRPLPGVRVRLAGSKHATLTNRNGYFRLWLPARPQPRAAYVLKLRLPGYRTQAVSRRVGAGVARIALQAALSLPEAPDVTGYTSGVPIMQEFVTEVTLATPPPAAPPRVVPATPPRFFSWLAGLFRHGRPVQR